MRPSGPRDPAAPVSPLPRRMWTFAGLLVLIGIVAAVGIVATGYRLEWDLGAYIGDSYSRRRMTLGASLILAAVIVALCGIGAVAFGRQAVMLTPERRDGA
jgi:hypothetical protein